MRRATLCVVACVVFGACTGTAMAQEAIFLVRHAERQDTSIDSALSAEGRARAARLAQMLRDAHITAIYVTEFQRTAETAQPLADLLKVPLARTPAADPGALLTKLRTSDPHARALVVSHADRLPTLLHDLGYPQEVTIPSAQYDDLFLVMPGERSSAPTVIRLRY